MNEGMTYAGSISRTIRDEEYDLSYDVLIHYPTLAESVPTNFGPYEMNVSPNADVMEGRHPLVIISHGNGGSHLIYHTISTYLAKRGYIVASIEHYGNNRKNNELEHSILNLQYRPRHISLAIDYLLEDDVYGLHIDSNSVSVVGHSFGGYSALAVSGGQPWTRQGEKVLVHKDPRIKSIVIMAPAAGYFSPPNSLDDVEVPILLLCSEFDKFTPKQWSDDIVLNGVKDKSLITYEVIKNGGHFSFISPFPPHMSGANFLPSTDPPGFDRQAFHQRLPQLIHNFLEEN